MHRNDPQGGGNGYTYYPGNSHGAYGVSYTEAITFSGMGMQKSNGPVGGPGASNGENVDLVGPEASSASIGTGFNQNWVVERRLEKSCGAVVVLFPELAISLSDYKRVVRRLR